MAYFHTHKERTEKRITLDFIKGQALALLLDKNRNNKLCTTRLSRYSPSELFTVSQADALIEEMVQDSLFYM